MQEINFIRPQEVYDRNTGESKVRYRSYDGNDRFIPVVDGEKGVPKTMVEVTHAELKAMRDGGKLTAGALYRITDYNCTTTQENTRSAGHQFDIVLLALSENKLAEEGWAMMHDNIYDVTFGDGVTLKCYVNLTDSGTIIVRTDTMLGGNGLDRSNYIIDEINKTALFPNTNSTELTDTVAELESYGVYYNYFQNSNLSAWKVWYCLDNDKSRFAWADDNVPQIEDEEGYGAAIWFTRHSNLDFGGKFAWSDSDSNVLYSDNINPKKGDKLYIKDNDSLIFDEDYVSNVKGFGRGVIYRLIDEWNNDVGYDFKNIQHKKNITDGLIDELHQGTDMHIYPFNIWINGECQDATLVGNTLADDVNEVYGVCNNIILNPPHGGGEDAITLLKVGLNTTCFLSTLDRNGYYGLRDSFIDGGCMDCAIENSSFIKLIKCVAVIIISCDALQLIACTSRKEGLTAGAIYIGDKKVLTES